jgi:hypothetical protein
VLTSVTNLSVQFTAANEDRPVGRVALFVDGHYERDLRLYEPSGGEIIQLNIAGEDASVVVSNRASLSDIAADVAREINRPDLTNVTKVIAAARAIASSFSLWM